MNDNNLNNYLITGKVVRGDSYGRKLGFPTANLEVIERELPPEGVYAGTSHLEGIIYRSGIVIGPQNKIEAHLLGYDGDAYGKIITLKLDKFLRGYKKFDTEKELIAQIEKDLKQC